MASVKKGQLTAPNSWNKHFTAWMKRLFWKKERKMARQDAHRRGRED